MATFHLFYSQGFTLIFCTSCHLGGRPCFLLLTAGATEGKVLEVTILKTCLILGVSYPIPFSIQLACSPILVVGAFLLQTQLFISCCKVLSEFDCPCKSLGMVSLHPVFDSAFQVPYKFLQHYPFHQLLWCSFPETEPLVGLVLEEMPQPGEGEGLSSFPGPKPLPMGLLQNF